MRRILLIFLLVAVVKSNYYEKFPELGFYKVFTTPATWNEAVKTCIDDEATLLVTNSNKENKKIVDLIKKQIPSNLNDGNGIIFLGYHNLFNEDELHTAYGGKFPDVDTERYEEIFSNRSEDGAHCGAMYADGTMTLRPCTQKFPFVCKKPLWKSYELASNDNYYKLYTDAATWSESLRTCEKDGAHLVVVSDVTEASILGEMIKRHKTFPSAKNNDFVAVGAHDLFRAGEVRSVLGHKVDLTVRSTEGVRLESENCVYIHRDDNFLYYGNCDHKFAFICEQGPEIRIIKTRMTPDECQNTYNMYHG